MRTVSRHGPLKLLILILMHACKLRIHEATPANIELIGIYCVDGGCPRGLQCSRTSSYAHVLREPSCQLLCNFEPGDCPIGWVCNLGHHGPVPDDAGGYCARPR